MISAGDVAFRGSSASYRNVSGASVAYVYDQLRLAPGYAETDLTLSARCFVQYDHHNSPDERYYLMRVLYQARLADYLDYARLLGASV